MNNKLLLNWYGGFSQGAGYSGSSEKIAIALEKLGVDIRHMSIRSKDLQANITEKGKEIKAKPFQLGEVGICYGLPNSFTSIQNKIKIGFSMFETDKLPRTKEENDWCGKDGQPETNCNLMDLMLVPSRHNEELFKREGVTTPIEVVHLGVDTDAYPKVERPPRKTFTFLMYGVLTIRKNPGAALSAFLDLYKDNPDVRIIFKTHSGTMGAVQMPYPNVQIIDEYTTPEKMKEYLFEADAFVFPSRGEGWGLPPLEAMATGLPTILSHNTGLSEYCDYAYNYPIVCPTKSPAQRFPKKWGNVGNWYEPDYERLKYFMKYVVDNREECYLNGLKASDWVRDNFTFDNTAKRILELVDQLLQNKARGL